MVKTATWTSGEPTSRSLIANSLINSAFLLALIDIVSFFNFGAKAGMSSSLRRLLDRGHSTGVVRIYYIGTDAQAFVLAQLLQLRLKQSLGRILCNSLNSRRPHSGSGWLEFGGRDAVRVAFRTVAVVSCKDN